MDRKCKVDQFKVAKSIADSEHCRNHLTIINFINRSEIKDLADVTTRNGSSTKIKMGHAYTTRTAHS